MRWNSQLKQSSLMNSQVKRQIDNLFPKINVDIIFIFSMCCNEGRNSTTTKSITFHRNQYKISMDVPSYTIKRGQPIHLKASIAYYDDTPIQFNQYNREILIGRNVQYNLTYQRYELNDNGTIAVRIPSDSLPFDVMVFFSAHTYKYQLIRNENNHI